MPPNVGRMYHRPSRHLNRRRSKLRPILDYCQRTQRSKTDILRELVRSLEQRPSTAAAESPAPLARNRKAQAFLAVQRDFAISARNLLRSKITAIAIDGVNAKLTLAVAPGVELVAIITVSSVERMQLAVGTEVYAVVTVVLLLWNITHRLGF